jgi:para-nitrobenzyl esterase
MNPHWHAILGLLRLVPLMTVLAGMCAAAPDPAVAVSGGAVRGRALEGGGSVFRGIPFAAPPVGTLRWREPMPVVPWQGVRDAEKPGPAPQQRSFGWNEAMSRASREDCLYLDVWAPPVDAAHPAPVMVWIHGGANLCLAGGSEPVYEGRPLVAHGVILVVIEYRVGVFGFMAHPELSRESPHGASGNYGLLDQVAALRWVRDNIAAFGGDPANVTVFGQSAGSMDIVALMASPLAQGLFAKAIAMSGVASRDMSRPLADAEKAGVDAAAALGVTGPGAIERMRAIPGDELARRAPDMNSFTVDGWVFPRSSFDVWAAGRERGIPLMIGGNGIEITLVHSPDEVRGAVQAAFGPAANPVLRHYGLGPGQTPLGPDPVHGDFADQWAADQFRCPTTVHAEWHRDAGNPVWAYEFDRAVAPRTLVRHSDELAFVFGNFLEKEGMVTGQFRPGDRELSAVMQGYWTNFAKTGNPNGPGLPPWPGLGTADTLMVFGADGTAAAGPNPRAASVDLFRELLRAQAAGRALRL